MKTKIYKAVYYGFVYFFTKYIDRRGICVYDIVRKEGAL